MREINEVWRPIEGFECLYEVSNLGRVKSLKFGKERILKPRNICTNHLQVLIYKNGVKKPFLVHRLVAQAFLPNPKNLPYINHIDENPLNNRVTNLEWCTHMYNIRYSKAKSINQYSLDGEYIKTWDCLREIEYQLGFTCQSVFYCCKGKTKQSHGFKWYYLDDPLQPEPPLF